MTALVFAAQLHTALSEGIEVATAFLTAVNYLRNRSWEVADAEGTTASRADTLLDEAVPGWRDELDDGDASHPSHWATFKLVGAPWLVEPARSDAGVE